MSRSWRRDPVQQECWRFMEVHLDLNLLATWLWIGGLFNVSLKKNMGKAISGGFSHLETCWCLHVTSLPARGLPGCKEHCFQCATPRSWTKWAHEPKAALRPKGNPRTGLQVLQNGTKHLCCRTDSGKIREAISLSLQSSSISTGNTPVPTCCRRLRCLHASAWWPRSDRLSGFLLTSYERNATEKLMERAVSCIQRACTSHKGFQKDDGHAKTVCVLRVAAGVLHWSTLQKPIEGIKRIEERSKRIQHYTRIQRDRRSASSAMSAYSPRVLGLIYIPMKLL